MGRRPRSGVTWFGNEFIGSTVSFNDLRQSWRLDQKISEHEFYEGEFEVSCGLLSEARAVYLCSRVDSDNLEPQKAVIKIRMQCNKPSAERAKQAVDTMGPSAEMEITALGELTKAGGSCTPTLHAWKHEKQGTQMWIPGGFIVYILMEKLPGMRLDDIWSLERKERYEVRKSFKEAWGECRACGVIPLDRGSRNLLWDRTAKKCYIFDFEQWVRAKERHKWDDSEYPSWDLAYWVVGDNRGAMDL